MNLPRINEYLQTLATLGAIAGLLVLGLEIRQSNQIAHAEIKSANFLSLAEGTMAEVDANIADARVRAIMHPDELTLKDKMNLENYLRKWVYLFLHEFQSLSSIGQERSDFAYLEDIAAMEAPAAFGSRFSRAWLQENEYWIDPGIYRAIQRGLADQPIGSDLEYYNRIDELAAAMP